jgi:hypothetical protein
MNLTSTIIPKSDQLNADDLLAGPITIRISSVEAGSAEQPVAVHYDSDNGRPYLPGKSMRRVLVQVWGADTKAYTGRSMTLYNDASVKWAGEEVGGIRISHMTDIADDITMALTVTRANKKPFTVKPLTVKNAAPQNPPVSDAPPVAGSAEAAPYSVQIKAAATMAEVISKSVSNTGSGIVSGATGGNKPVGGFVEGPFHVRLAGA